MCDQEHRQKQEYFFISGRCDQITCCRWYGAENRIKQGNTDCGVRRNPEQCQNRHYKHRPACTGSSTDSTGYSTKYQVKRNALDCFFLCISRLVFPKQDGNSGEQNNEI